MLTRTSKAWEVIKQTNSSLICGFRGSRHKTRENILDVTFFSYDEKILNFLKQHHEKINWNEVVTFSVRFSTSPRMCVTTSEQKGGFLEAGRPHSV
jgi:hypothetical protein